MVGDDYYVLVHGILRYAYSSLKSVNPVDTEQISAEALDVDEQYWEYVMRNLVNEGFVSGVKTVKRSGTSVPGIKITRLEITPAGIAYFQENSMLKKAEDIAIKVFGFVGSVLSVTI